MIFTDSKLGIQELVSSLNHSEPVVMPTETVYGLAAKINDLTSLKKIFLYKKRPFFDPLIVHIFHSRQLAELSQFESQVITKLTEAFWPGPLTLVLPKLPTVSDIVTSGLDSVGVRMPNHPLALQLLEAIGVPLAAPSANLFGQTSPTKAQHVEADFPNLKILDGGQCEIGIESTVLKILPIGKNRVSLAILRKGSITQSAINAALLGLESDFQWTDAIDFKQSPGHMKHHYMPAKPIVFFDKPIDIRNRLTTIQNDFQKIPDSIENVIIVKPQGPLERFEKLSFSIDPVIACRELYGNLKQAASGNSQILIFEKQTYMVGELWDAFLERLTKASSLHYSS